MSLELLSKRVYAVCAFRLSSGCLPFDCYVSLGKEGIITTSQGHDEMNLNLEPETEAEGESSSQTSKEKMIIDTFMIHI